MRRRWPRRIALALGGLLLLVLAAGALLLLPRLPALRFLLALAEDVPPDGQLPPGFERVTEATLPGPRRALVCRPDGAPPFPVLVVVHGIAEKGIDDGRLLRVAAGFRRAGFLTVVPEIGAMVRMENRDHDEVRLVRLLAALAQGALPEARADALGVFGISVGGGLALTSVARFKADGGRGPRALALLGAPEDMDRVARDWFRRPPPPPEGAGAEFQRREAGLFARNALLRFAAPRLAPGDPGREIAAWLAEAWRPTRAPPEVTGPAAESLIRLATDPLAASDEEVRAVLDATRDLLDPLSASRIPEAALAALSGTDVFLLHGIDDPLVPLGELAALSERLEGRTRVRSLRSRLVGHTEVTRQEIWPHLVFLDAFFDAVDP